MRQIRPRIQYQISPTHSCKESSFQAIGSHPGGVREHRFCYRKHDNRTQPARLPIPVCERTFRHGACGTHRSRERSCGFPFSSEPERNKGHFDKSNGDCSSVQIMESGTPSKRRASRITSAYGGVLVALVPPLAKTGNGRQFLCNQAAYRQRSKVSLPSLGVGSGGDAG